MRTVEENYRFLHDEACRRDERLSAVTLWLFAASSVVCLSGALFWCFVLPAQASPATGVASCTVINGVAHCLGGQYSDTTDYREYVCFSTSGPSNFCTGAVWKGAAHSAAWTVDLTSHSISVNVGSTADCSAIRGIRFGAYDLGTFAEAAHLDFATPSGTCAYSTPAVCGDGYVQSPETCDDGNLYSGDGCSVSCVEEPRSVCTGSPSVCMSAGDGCSTDEAPVLIMDFPSIWMQPVSATTDDVTIRWRSDFNGTLSLHYGTNDEDANVLTSSYWGRTGLLTAKNLTIGSRYLFKGCTTSTACGELCTAVLSYPVGGLRPVTAPSVDIDSGRPVCHFWGTDGFGATTDGIGPCGWSWARWLWSPDPAVIGPAFSEAFSPDGRLGRLHPILEISALGSAIVSSSEATSDCLPEFAVTTAGLFASSDVDVCAVLRSSDVASSAPTWSLLTVACAHLIGIFLLIMAFIFIFT